MTKRAAEKLLEAEVRDPCVGPGFQEGVYEGRRWLLGEAVLDVACGFDGVQ